MSSSETQKVINPTAGLCSEKGEVPTVPTIPMGKILQVANALSGANVVGTVKSTIPIMSDSPSEIEPEVEVAFSQILSEEPEVNSETLINTSLKDTQVATLEVIQKATPEDFTPTTDLIASKRRVIRQMEQSVEFLKKNVNDDVANILELMVTTHVLDKFSDYYRLPIKHQTSYMQVILDEIHRETQMLIHNTLSQNTRFVLPSNYLEDGWDLFNIYRLDAYKLADTQLTQQELE